MRETVLQAGAVKEFKIWFWKNSAVGKAFSG